MSSTLTILLLVAPAALAVLAAGLLVYALRGRRVDDHPICRKCGFDLFGRPEGATLCSECGADLGRSGAVRVGRREPRRRIVVAAAPVLVLCGLWLAALGWVAVKGESWGRYKPVWWLMAEARGRHAAARDEALAELADRIDAGNLSQAHADTLVDLALDVQADPARPWSDGYGELIGRLHDAGKLPPEKWKRYARQAAVLKFSTRATLRRGDPLVMGLETPTPRIASRHAFNLFIDLTDARIGGVRVVKGSPGPQWGVGMVSRPGSGGGGTTTHLPVHAPALAQLADGPHTFRWTVQLGVSDGRAPGGPGARLVNETVEFSAPLTVLPPGASGVALNRDPSLRPAVEKALSVHRLTVDPSFSPRPHLSGQVRAEQAPIGLAYRVFLRRADGREWDVGGVNFSRAASSNTLSSYYLHRTLKDLPGFDADRVDVVLRPSLDDAHRTIDLTEIWDGEVVIKDVPVRPPDTPRTTVQTQPTTRPGA